ncbi:hypothetical protein GGG87_02835 [Streptococcus sp. zg-86]|uniref:DUF443 family protein n=1 Tax=Streptococcus zhangguiae TaxID=2664091 RepID=A0ABW9R1J1_9STRE|nr:MULTISPECIES: hypothetical protein [unclassified Streptococcus]MTB63936.1 hypothetical protein [Streptococcus sp. zg-86]MTB90246.1 hypothetical protein [Streptococcus sp. zg-36]QTH46965.1 hypothetical protein J5M87_05190 [Streptococcus sp. zg-86]
MSNQSKIELFHDGEKTYYYDFHDGNIYIKNQNTLKYREQSQKFLKNSIGLSLTIGLLSVVVNRWYRIISSFQLNIALLVIGFLFFFILCFYLDMFIKKNIVDDSIFIPSDIGVINIENLLIQSIKLANFFRNLSFISIFMSIVGISIFLKFSILLGLGVTIFCCLFSFGIIRYLDIPRRYKAIKKLRDLI